MPTVDLPIVLIYERITVIAHLVLSFGHMSEYSDEIPPVLTAMGVSNIGHSGRKIGSSVAFGAFSVI